MVVLGNRIITVRTTLGSGIISPSWLVAGFWLKPLQSASPLLQAKRKAVLSVQGARRSLQIGYRLRLDHLHITGVELPVMCRSGRKSLSKWLWFRKRIFLFLIPCPFQQALLVVLIHQNQISLPDIVNDTPRQSFAKKKLRHRKAYEPDRIASASAANAAFAWPGVQALDDAGLTAPFGADRVPIRGHPLAIRFPGIADKCGAFSWESWEFPNIRLVPPPYVVQKRFSTIHLEHTESEP